MAREHKSGPIVLADLEVIQDEYEKLDTIQEQLRLLRAETSQEKLTLTEQLTGEAAEAGIDLGAKLEGVRETILGLSGFSQAQPTYGTIVELFNSLAQKVPAEVGVIQPVQRNSQY